METIIFKMGSGEKDCDTMEKAAEIIKNGGLVAFPTETVYGLGADAGNPEAAKKIYAAKGRPSDNPLIVHIAEMKDLNVVSEYVPKKAEPCLTKRREVWIQWLCVCRGIPWRWN